VDGSTVNVYPREIVGKSSYLLNREVGTIVLKNINGPTDALTSLMKLLPDEQLGYAGIGVNNDYPEPWNAVFSNLTVRQLMSRLSEHDGPRGGWISSGSRGNGSSLISSAALSNPDRHWRLTLDFSGNR